MRASSGSRRAGEVVATEANVNAWQVARQLAYRLRSRTWPDGAAENIVRTAYVSAEGLEEVALELAPPYALITIGSAQTDPEAADLIRQTFDVLLVASGEGDEIGQRAVAGGPRSAAGQGSSLGRGLLEIEEEMMRALGLDPSGSAGESLGIGLRCTHRGAAAGAKTSGLGSLVARSYALEAVCTRRRTYHAPLRLTATGGVGQVTLAWALPPDRFDRRRMVVRRLAGAVAPALPTAGTDVPVAALAVGVADAGLAPGDYSYGVWMAYNETWTEQHDAATASASDERFSDQETGTTRTTTVT